MRRVRVLHIEPTDVCQAACALCARETDPEFRKDLKHHLRIEQVQAHFSDAQISKLDKVFMCGSYGDPAAGKHTLDMMRWFRTLNPDITLGMNTNGAIQSTFWWHELGGLHTKPLDYCVFSIDGLEDTNHVYRKGVDWTKLMHNARAYIAAGGSAHWDMLVYRHNQHQVDECEQLARDMGFKWFRAKVSRRGFTDRLQAPYNWAQPAASGGRIDCHVIKEKSMYIDAQGRVGPCCWQGSRQSNFVKDDLITLKATWRTDTPDAVCVASCSVPNGRTVFEDQWQKQVELIPIEVQCDN